MTIQEQYDALLKKYRELLAVAKKGLESCGRCHGSGEMKWGLVTDASHEIVPCDTCGRPALKVFMKEFKDFGG